LYIYYLLLNKIHSRNNARIILIFQYNIAVYRMSYRMPLSPHICFNHKEGKLKRQLFSSIHPAIDAFKTFLIFSNRTTLAGSRILPTLPIRLVASVWCLVSVVLVNAYTCILTSYLMSPRFHAMVDSIEDIAAIPRPILMFERYTAYESFVLVIKICNSLL